MDYWDTPLAGYIINVCRPGRVGMECLDRIMKENMIEASSDGKQADDYRLYTDKKYSGRVLRRFKDDYNQIKVKVACYLATGTDGRFKTPWSNIIGDVGGGDFALI